jgi:uncharacterized protein YifE (UPF0438 family)
MVATSLAELVLQQTGTILEALKYLEHEPDSQARQAFIIVTRAAAEMETAALRRANASDAAELRRLAKANVLAVLMPEVPSARKSA